MIEREYPQKIKEADVERSTEDIRQDIEKGKENISQTVEQIGERIKEKIDWREYVKQSPYWALGAAAGLGYLASRMLTTRTTPMERIMRPIAEEVRSSLSGLLGGAAGSNLIKMALIGIATKAAGELVKRKTQTDAACACPKPRPRKRPDSTINPGVNR